MPTLRKRLLVGTYFNLFSVQEIVTAFVVAYDWRGGIPTIVVIHIGSSVSSRAQAIIRKKKTKTACYALVKHCIGAVTRTVDEIAF